MGRIRAKLRTVSWSGDQFCVIGAASCVRYGGRRTDPDLTPAPAHLPDWWKVVYTVGFGSISDPDVLQSIIDDFGWSSYLYDTRLGGEVVHQSTPRATDGISRPSMAEADESIYNARLLDVETDTESGDYVRQPWLGRARHRGCPSQRCLHRAAGMGRCCRT